MTDHQFECLHILLVNIANDLSAIRAEYESNKARMAEFEKRVAEFGAMADAYAKQQAKTALGILSQTSAQNP